MLRFFAICEMVVTELQWAFPRSILTLYRQLYSMTSFKHTRSLSDVYGILVYFTWSYGNISCMWMEGLVEL